MSARFAVLGAGSIVPRVGYGPAGYALELEEGGPVTLFDCGPGTIRALPSVGLDPARIERVVLSHFHTDHLLDLFALAFLRRNPALGSLPELELIGPVGLARLVEQAPSVLGRWVTFEDTRVVEVRPDEGGRGSLRSGDLALSFATTGHTPEALAWRAELPDGTGIVYSGDSAAEPRVGELARDADLFVVECSFPDGAGTENHLTPSQVVGLVQRARPKRLLLTHFYPEADPVLCARQVADSTGIEVLAASDGLVLELPGPA